MYLSLYTNKVKKYTLNILCSYTILYILCLKYTMSILKTKGEGVYIKVSKKNFSLLSKE